MKSTDPIIPDELILMVRDREWKADWRYTFVNDSQVSAMGTNGLPLYHIFSCIF